MTWLSTGIILEMDGNFPIDHNHRGFAKNLKIAEWIFELCGWKDPSGGDYPCLTYVVEVIEWPEGDLYFPCDSRELYVLNARLIMN